MFSDYNIKKQSYIKIMLGKKHFFYKLNYDNELYNPSLIDIFDSGDAQFDHV